MAYSSSHLIKVWIDSSILIWDVLRKQKTIIKVGWMIQSKIFEQDGDYILLLGGIGSD